MNHVFKESTQTPDNQHLLAFMLFLIPAREYLLGNHSYVLRCGSSSTSSCTIIGSAFVI